MAPSQLQIKSNALKRLLKDKKAYQQEIKDHEASIAKLETSLKSTTAGTESEEQQYTLKNLIKIKDETIRLLPSLNSKLEEILNDLKSYLSVNEQESNDEIKSLISETEASLAA
ncbi:unnamed protein product [Ambrosiozyma monospora]|uniref:Tubulin-specific chaperone A n=1 Tax=Ambrosiozyma monospora TaxID=43982 RepID=A0A9W6Z7I8_AMBMO|nr:unnamed protein product [Ambrosiozyma monospora]